MIFIIGRLCVKSIRLIAADVALANVATTTGGANAQGEALLSRKARGTWLLCRGGSEWLISAMRGFPTEEDSVELVASLETADSLKSQIRELVRAYEEVGIKGNLDILPQRRLSNNRSDRVQRPFKFPYSIGPSGYKIEYSNSHSI